MKQRGFSVVIVFMFASYSAYSQCDNCDYGLEEIDRASKTVRQMHLNDEFYLQMRCVYDVRESIDDYIILKENGIGIWRAEHRKEMTDPPPWEGDINTQRKIVTKVSYMEEDKIDAFLKAIDIDRLVHDSTIDSLTLVDTGEEPVLGFNYFAIMICSKGKFRLIEYPFKLQHYNRPNNQRTPSVPWRSAYLDNLIARFTQALPMGEYERIFEVYDGILSLKRR